MCSVKKVFLKILQNSQVDTCVDVNFLLSCWPKICKLIKKETPTQVFYCVVWENVKDTYYKKLLQTAASLYMPLSYCFNY